jgi:hypothetical protein
MGSSLDSYGYHYRLLGAPQELAAAWDKRRDGVDRLAATLIFAGWDRMSAVPLTRFATARPWQRAPGDRSAAAASGASGPFTCSADFVPANQSQGLAFLRGTLVGAARPWLQDLGGSAAGQADHHRDEPSGVGSITTGARSG